MVLGLLTWERWEHFGFAARAVEIGELLLVFLLLGLIYARMSWGKKQTKRSVGISPKR